MQYIKVAQIDDVKDGEKKKIALDDKVILLTRIEGAYYAIDNRCPHMGGSLYDGILDGSHITCPRHGSVFDVTTGQVVQSGKIMFIRVKVGDVRAYPVKVEGTEVLIGVE